MLMYFHRRAICALLHGPAAQDQAVTIQNLGPCRLHAWQDTHLPGIAGPISYYATRQHARSLQSKHKASGSSKSGAGAEAEAAPGAAAAQPASGSWWIPSLDLAPGRRSCAGTGKVACRLILWEMQCMPHACTVIRCCFNDSVCCSRQTADLWQQALSRHRAWMQR